MAGKNPLEGLEEVDRDMLMPVPDKAKKETSKEKTKKKE